MNYVLLVEQTLNGLQLGVMLFLIAAGLTLVFGIMNFINLAHGSFYMLGAFFAAALTKWTGSFVLGLALAVLACVALGVILEMLALRPLYARDHLDQVLATFSLILFFNEMTSIVWGTEPQYIMTPALLSGSVELFQGVHYPVLRLAVTGFGLAVGLLLYGIVTHTRIGMLIRAGASNRQMVQGLGVNIGLLFSFTFGLGAALAGFAGMITAPLLAVQVGIGEPMLIVAFVVVVIGGIGSVRGAFVSALLVGLVDTMGRFLLPAWLGYRFGPALASMAIYILMAAVLLWRPQGLFSGFRG
ncbi:MAG: ABC transporter permease [Betaproteobacteria bacterium RIFCSPLOWO2_12_FULL_65_14]|nr:MAG: ABC transporter permease [Betaproteobacteria bacterium RIFCSPLOWO2_12_FULL_65_14]